MPWKVFDMGKNLASREQAMIVFGSMATNCSVTYDVVWPDLDTLQDDIKKREQVDMLRQRFGLPVENRPASRKKSFSTLEASKIQRKLLY